MTASGPIPVPSGYPACFDGCCVATTDYTLPRLRRPYARPMFEVLRDAGNLDGELDADDDDAMRVPTDEYQRPERVFL